MIPRAIHILRGRSCRISRFHTGSVLWASKKVMKQFKLADIGEGITECEVIKWNLQPPTPVQTFDQLCEVQSDKASVEITSPYDGILKELLVQEGEVAKVGQGLCLIEVEEEASESDSTSTVSESEPPPHPVQEAVQSPSLTSKTETGTQLVSDVPPVPVPGEEPRKRRPHPLDPNYPQTADSILHSFNQNVLAKPSVRHLARVRGVDLGRISPGSGKAGRIEMKDLEAYLAGGGKKVEGAAGAKAGDKGEEGKEVVVALGRTRYGMWKAMEKSLEIPHFGYSTTFDITELHNLLPTLNSYIPSYYSPTTPSPALAVNPSSVHPAPSPPPVPPSGQYTRLTYLPLFLKTLSKAMHEWPLFRSSITPNAAPNPSTKPTLTVRPHADISIALSTRTGLYTPTVQNVNSRSIYSLASRLKHLSHLGRQVPSGLTPNEMPKRGGTVTVSNIGSIGSGDFAHPILVPGTGVAIVAIGRAKWVWDVDRGDGNGERRLKVGVSWSADHRVVEGAELAAFVESWRGWVEVPQRLIGESV